MRKKSAGPPSKIRPASDSPRSSPPRTVAEVLLGLLAGDPFTFLNVQPTWRPRKGEFGAPKDGVFGVADLLRFAGVLIK